MTDWTKYGQTDDEPDSVTQSSSGDDEVTAESGTGYKPVSLHPVPSGTDWTAQKRTSTVTDDEESDPPRVTQPRIGNKGFAVMFTSVILLAAATCAWLWIASPVGDEPEPDTATPPQASQAVNTAVAPAEPSAKQKPASQIKLGGQCEGADGTAVEPSTGTPYGAVAAFQRAYYDGDKTELLKTVTDTSPLKKQDWDKVFESMDKKSTYCVEMKPMKKSEIPVTLTVTDSKGKDTTYAQRVSVSENSDDATWQISQIRKA